MPFDAARSRRRGPSRREAIKEGLTNYFGKPCKYCGGEERNVSSRACVGCISERRRDYYKKWREKNRDIVRDYKVHADSCRRKAMHEGMTSAEFREWRAKAPKSCFYCGAAKSRLTVDHFWPLSKGGLHHASNLVVACHKCNSKKSNRNPYEFMLDKVLALGVPDMEKEVHLWHDDGLVHLKIDESVVVTMTPAQAKDLSVKLFSMIVSTQAAK